MAKIERSYQHSGNGGGKQWGDDNDNSLLGTVGKDVIHGAGGNDTITGLDADDKLWGDDGNDTIDGGAGKDKIDGGAGDDILFGGDGRDDLTGGMGADTFTGGADRDRFRLGSLDEANGDHITDYDAAGKDRIDVKWSQHLGADGTTTVDDGATFSFVGTGAFTDAHQVRVEGSGTEWTVFVNVDADLGADYSFSITTVAPGDLTAKDFHL